jgi:glycosyltransferase involved in cell wall biosynthesis
MDEDCEDEKNRSIQVHPFSSARREVMANSDFIIFHMIAAHKKDKLLVLNLLSVSSGGHVTRANNFLKRVRIYLPDVHIIILKRSNLVLDIDLRDGLIDEFNLKIKTGTASKMLRIIFENLILPLLLFKKHCVFLTFSHYLPLWLPSSAKAIVGVTNLAPFSDLAISEESSFLKKARLFMLKHSILNACTKADRVIAISNFCMEILVSNGINNNKIDVVPNGVSEYFFGDKTAISPWPKKYMLCVSNFYSYKNYINLVKAYALMPKKIQSEFDLLLIGWSVDSSYLSKVESKIKECALEDKVKILSNIQHEELKTYYQNSAIFIFPSLIENCPNILLEALASGVCTIASNVNPMPEFGGAAVDYFDPLSPEDIAEKILFKIDNDLYLERLPQSIIQAKKFSWDSFTKQVSNMCLESF